MLKRVSSIVLTVAMLLTLLCNVTVASAAGEKPQLALSVLGKAETNEPVEVERGEEITLLVSLKNYVPAVGLDVDGTYDANALTSPTFKTNHVGDIEFFDNDAEVRAIWANPTPLPAIDKLFTVSFMVADDAPEGVTEVKFSIEKYAVLVDEHVQNLTSGNDYIVNATLMLKIGHNFGDSPVVKPTSENDLRHKQYCSDCKEDIYTACDFEKKTAVSPTCTEGGYIPSVCKVCGYEVRENSGSATGHSYSEWKPSTTEKGKHIRTCKKGCGASETESCASYYVTSTNATCTAAGTKVCQRCGGTATGAPATGHNWGAWVNVPGTKTHKSICSNANCPVGTRTANCKIELDSASSVSATCTTGGKKVYKCTDNCGYVRVENVGPLGHVWTQDAGAKTHSCKNCNEDRIACSVNFVVKEATCTTKGLAKCVCGRDLVIEPNGEHPYEKMVTVYKAPTATAAGYFGDHCNACGEDVKYENYENGKLEDYIEVAAGNPFTDIKSGSTWFYDPAVFCYSYNGIMIGEYGKFNGNGQITRGQVVTVLGRIIFSNYSDKGADAFINGLSDAEFEELLDSFDANYGLNVGELKDLKGSYYDRYAEVLAHMGIVKGYDDNTFRGDQKVTRQEMATFMMRFLNSDEIVLERKISDASATFTDMDQVASWATSYVTESGKCGLFVGADGRFRPNDNATRGELATLLERIIRATEVYPIVDYADFIKK